MTRWTIFTFNIITYDTWSQAGLRTFPQGSHASQTTCSLQGSFPVSYSVSPIMTSMFFLLNQGALISCFLYQSILLPWFNFPILGRLFKRVMFGLWLLLTSSGFIHVSNYLYSWLISGKRAFILSHWSRSPKKDYCRMMKNLNKWRRS